MNVPVSARSVGPAASDARTMGLSVSTVSSSKDRQGQPETIFEVDGARAAEWAAKWRNTMSDKSLRYIGKSETGGSVFAVGKAARHWLIANAQGKYWDAVSESWVNVVEATEFNSEQEAQMVARRLPLETGASGVRVTGQ